LSTRIENSFSWLIPTSTDLQEGYDDGDCPRHCTLEVQNIPKGIGQDTHAQKTVIEFNFAVTELISKVHGTGI
jgi:hypothetical protein